MTGRPGNMDRGERDAMVRKLVREGESLRGIAEACRTSRTEVYRSLDRLGISREQVRVAKAEAPAPRKQKHATDDKEPGIWPQSEALRHRTEDRAWGLCWFPVSAEKFAEFMLELTRTPGEYTRNGGAHWSPTHAELAERLRVPVELVDDWAEEGVYEPWEICVVRAYARTGVVETTDDARVPRVVVERVLHRARGLSEASKITRIPVAMLQHHLEVGAPARTHGRAYLLMDSESYRAVAVSGGRLEAESQAADETIARMLAEGATIQQICAEIDMNGNSVSMRMKKLGLEAARARKGGRQAAQKPSPRRTQ